MAFKFDDDDDELSLDSKIGDKVKTNIPTPLPKVAKPSDSDKVAEKAEVSKPAPKKPSIPTAPSKPSIPTKPEVIPVPEPIIEDEDAYAEETYQPEPEVVEAIEPAVVEPTVRRASEPRREVVPPATPKASARSRAKAVVNENNELEIEQQAVLSKEEAKSTIRKKQAFYKNDRQKVKRIRILAGIVGGVLLAAGLFSFFPKATFSNDMNSIFTSVSWGNKFNSIMDASESFALKFSSDYLNRTETSEQYRSDKLETYMSGDSVTEVDFDLSTIPDPKDSYDKGAVIYQKIISGPYVDNFMNVEATQIADMKVMDGNGYLVTVIVSAYVQDYVNVEDLPAGVAMPSLSPHWVYLSIPVVHNFDTKETSLYGYPTFVNPPLTKSYGDYAVPFDAPDWKTNDDVLSDDAVLEARIEGFMAAWAKQDPSTAVSPELQGFLTQDHNVRVERGLNGAYQGNKDETIVADFAVEPMPKDTVATSTDVRKALVTVKWVNASQASNSAIKPSVYTQQYIVYFSGNSEGWYVSDIKPRYAEK